MQLPLLRLTGSDAVERVWHGLRDDELARLPMRETFAEKVERHHKALKARGGYPIAWEEQSPEDEAANWFEDMVYNMPKSAIRVGRQIARLCGDDTQATTTYRSLADAVGVRDKRGRTTAYVQRGLKALSEWGWIKVVTTGKGRAASTTFYLMPGDAPRVADPTYEADLIDELAAA